MNLYYLLLFPFSLLPHKFAKFLGISLGSLYYRIDKKHRLEVQMRIQKCLHVSDEKKIELSKQFYQYFGVFVIEMTRLPFHNKKSIHKIVSGLQIEKFQEILKEGNGCILVTGHFGNWEYAGMALSTMGLPINAVSKPLKMASLDRFLNQCRQKSGINTINQKNAYREMLKVLKNNEIVVLLLDFDTSPEKGGIFVPFFGEMAACIPTAAMVHLKTKAPIIVTRLRRNPDLINSYVEIDQIIHGSDCLTKEEKIYDITQKINESYERFIESSPPEWLWLQRRWRFPYENKLLSANKAEDSL